MVCEEKQIREILGSLPVPLIGRTVDEMNLLRSVVSNKGKFVITLASPFREDVIRKAFRHQMEQGLQGHCSIEEIEVKIESGGPSSINRIQQVIAVISGKGGVGKSLVSSLIALALRRSGQKVGILDGDITGPSIPRMFGLNGTPAGGEGGIFPAITRSGIAVMSINLLLEQDDDPVIWRGPLIARAITQFWEEVYWGDIDTLVVDCPPGTADAPLTVMQSLPVSSVVVVFSPQNLVEMIVRKAVKMVRSLEKPLLGAVENMSYLNVPGVEKPLHVFGPSRAVELTAALGIPLLGQIPLDPDLARLCDEGKIEFYRSKALEDFEKKLLGELAVSIVKQ